MILNCINFAFNFIIERMKLFTEVNVRKDSVGIDHSRPLMLMGSCFADNIGERLVAGKFDCCVNPFGTLYNPFSICSAIRRIASARLFTADSEEIFSSGGLWHSWMHHSSFSNASKEEFLSGVNSALLRASAYLASSGVVILTLGTSWVYRLSQPGAVEVVANCHKMPERMFERKMESVDAVYNALSGIYDIISEVNPSCRLIFTVSPIRHVRDGLHSNALSKAVLLLAINELTKKNPDKIVYFPAYEIMNDELRDYRFYADDLVHPSSMAIDILWQRFSDCFFSADTKAFVAEWGKINAALNHRPITGMTDEYRSFISSVKDKIEKIKSVRKYLDVDKELEICNTKLMK